MSLALLISWLLVTTLSTISTNESFENELSLEKSEPLDWVFEPSEVVSLLHLPVLHKRPGHGVRNIGTILRVYKNQGRFQIDNKTEYMDESEFSINTAAAVSTAGETSFAIASWNPKIGASVRIWKAKFNFNDSITLETVCEKALFDVHPSVVISNFIVSLHFTGEGSSKLLILDDRGSIYAMCPKTCSLAPFFYVASSHHSVFQLPVLPSSSSVLSTGGFVGSKMFIYVFYRSQIFTFRLTHNVRWIEFLPGLSCLLDGSSSGTIASGDLDKQLSKKNSVDRIWIGTSKNSIHLIEMSKVSHCASRMMETNDCKCSAAFSYFLPSTQDRRHLPSVHVSASSLRSLMIASNGEALILMNKTDRKKQGLDMNSSKITVIPFENKGSVYNTNVFTYVSSFILDFSSVSQFFQQNDDEVSLPEDLNLLPPLLVVPCRGCKVPVSVIIGTNEVKQSTILLSESIPHEFEAKSKWAKYALSIIDDESIVEIEDEPGTWLPLRLRVGYLPMMLIGFLLSSWFSRRRGSTQRIDQELESSQLRETLLQMSPRQGAIYKATYMKQKKNESKSSGVFSNMIDAFEEARANQQGIAGFFARAVEKLQDTYADSSISGLKDDQFPDELSSTMSAKEFEEYTDKLTMMAQIRHSMQGSSYDHSDIDYPSFDGVSTLARERFLLRKERLKSILGDEFSSGEENDDEIDGEETLEQ
jgi:hypothetical protein